jgi:hypothetical protein
VAEQEQEQAPGLVLVLEPGPELALVPVPVRELAPEPAREHWAVARWRPHPG